MAEDEGARLLRMRVQVEWEKAMDRFYEGLDGLYSDGVTDADLIEAVSDQIDDDTAEGYQNWIQA